MPWRRLIFSLALIAALIQPVLAQDDSEAPPDQAPAAPPESPIEPAPTATSAPAAPAGPPAPGTVLLADNFDDPAPGRLPRTSPDAAHYERGYAEGEYVLYKVDPEFNGTAFAQLPGTYGNSSLAVDVRIVGDAGNRYIALYCRIQPGSGFKAYSVLVFPGEGTLRLYRYDDGTATPMTDLVNAPAIRRGTETNRLELGCAGQTIFVTVNGTRVAAVGDGTYQTGSSRVATGAVRMTSQARVDNLVVTQVAEEVPPTPQGPGRYDGGWTGQTAPGAKANSFTVRNNAVVSLNLDYEVGGTTCSVSGTPTLLVTPAALIENDSFSVSATREATLRSTAVSDQSTYSGTLIFNVRGRFTSTTSASGETEIFVNSAGDPANRVPPCQGSTTVRWTATKN